MLARDHYAALDLTPEATAEEIEQAYRHLTRRYHPDVNPGDPRAAAVFERLREAYEVLSDPERRQRYDRGGAAEGAPTRQVGLAVRVLSDPSGGGSWGDVLRQLSEHARRARPQRGQDITVTVDVPLAQAERGRRVAVSLRRQVACANCSGRGRVRLDASRTCERCGGGGTETFLKGSLAISAGCADCGGDGVLAGSPCEPCAGSGLESRSDRLVVRVPGGVQDGQEVRLEGLGNAGPRGGRPGDLVVRAHVVPTSGFERQGPHLRRTVSVPYTLAILGGRIEVRTIDGDTATLRLPPLTRQGMEFRLRGRGLEMSDGRRGDMLVRVQIRMPESIDEDRKRLVRQLAESGPERTPRPAGSSESDR